MRRINVNMLLVGCVAAVILAFVLLMFAGAGVMGEGAENLARNISDMRGDGEEIGDVEGYGIIMNGFAMGMAGLAQIFLFIMGVLALIFDIILFILALIARLVFAPKGARLVIYRVLMTLVSVMFAAVEVLLVSVLTGSFTVLGLILSVILFAVILVTLINTYSKRILQ